MNNKNDYDNDLELIKESYDRGIVDYGKKDALSYDNLPGYITNDPDYPKYKIELEIGYEGSKNKGIKDYLSPTKDMKFIDLGCCLNLMFYGYDNWQSLYYGVDISPETIKLLERTISKRDLSIGALFCGSIHETPFDDNFFDIGACIGVLEYFEKEFVEKALAEIHRIIKPNGKFVLDIPNIKSPTGRIMMLIEEYMGRPDKFNMLSQEFEDVLQKYFEIKEKGKNSADTMSVVYFLKCKK
ncbi:MAG: class I SAM-dependent methyltransferase [Bacilli bacterium]|nr:class I SAM-dependent methyltransferase [Bacilli bacterium]